MACCSLNFIHLCISIFLECIFFYCELSVSKNECFVSTTRMRILNVSFTHVCFCFTCQKEPWTKVTFETTVATTTTTKANEAEIKWQLWQKFSWCCCWWYCYCCCCYCLTDFIVATICAINIYRCCIIDCFLL